MSHSSLQARAFVMDLPSFLAHPKCNHIPAHIGSPLFCDLHLSSWASFTYMTHSMSLCVDLHSTLDGFTCYTICLISCARRLGLGWLFIPPDLYQMLSFLSHHAWSMHPRLIFLISSRLINMPLTHLICLASLSQCALRSSHLIMLGTQPNTSLPWFPPLWSNLSWVNLV